MKYCVEIYDDLEWREVQGTCHSDLIQVCRDASLIQERRFGFSLEYDRYAENRIRIVDERGKKIV